MDKKDFSIVLSKKGTILCHPLTEMVYNQQNMFTEMEAHKAANKNYENNLAIMHKAVAGERGDGTMTIRSGEPFWYSHRPISSTGWALIVNFLQDSVSTNGRLLRRESIFIALGLIVFFTTLVALLLGLYDAREL
ncbi:MAG: hypothetical protein HQL28_05100, partial [Candidatus Omnitrophica bacterium]|nr:hypothetical protein [Candidatus Omnitrophota bacterium]